VPASVVRNLVPLQCDHCVIRHRAVCGALTRDDLARIDHIARQKQYRAGETIFIEGDEVDYFGNVLSGVVKLSKLLPDGRQQIVGLQFASDFVGRAFRGKATCNAEAATDVELCIFPRKPFESLLTDIHDLEDRLFANTLDELDAAREWLLLLGRQPPRKKVAWFLLMIARRIPNIGCSADVEADSIRFDLPLWRADIADFLGLTIETVSRQMTRLKTDGLIEVEQYRTITVPSVSRLEAAASQ
jgi:CRP/FNR family transcriptional regulator